MKEGSGVMASRADVPQRLRQVGTACFGVAWAASLPAVPTNCATFILFWVFFVLMALPFASPCFPGMLCFSYVSLLGFPRSLDLGGQGMTC